MVWAAGSGNGETREYRESLLWLPSLQIYANCFISNHRNSRLANLGQATLSNPVFQCHSATNKICCMKHLSFLIIVIKSALTIPE